MKAICAGFVRDGKSYAGFTPTVKNLHKYADHIRDTLSDHRKQLKKFEPILSDVVSRKREAEEE